MKTQCTLSSMLATPCESISSSCAASTANTMSVNVPESLIGTKWITVFGFLGIRNTVEFVDETHVIYSFVTGPKEMTYKLRGTKIIFSNRDIFDLHGKVMYYRGIPHFVNEEYFNKLIHH